MGERAMELLLAAPDEAAMTTVDVPTELVIRASTAPVAERSDSVR